ncbi:hypothetical protein D3C87_176960 [compost metagenome]
MLWLKSQFLFGTQCAKQSLTVCRRLRCSHHHQGKLKNHLKNFCLEFYKIHRPMLRDQERGSAHCRTGDTDFLLSTKPNARTAGI